jgi:hypothetical protein
MVRIIQGRTKCINFVIMVRITQSITNFIGFAIMVRIKKYHEL